MAEHPTQFGEAGQDPSPRDGKNEPSDDEPKPTAGQEEATENGNGHSDVGSSNAGNPLNETDMGDAPLSANDVDHQDGQSPLQDTNADVESNSSINDQLPEVEDDMDLPGSDHDGPKEENPGQPAPLTYKTPQFLSPSPTPIRPLQDDPRFHNEDMKPEKQESEQDEPKGVEKSENEDGKKMAVPTSRMFQHPTGSSSFYNPVNEQPTSIDASFEKQWERSGSGLSAASWTQPPASEAPAISAPQDSNPLLAQQNQNPSPQSTASTPPFPAGALTPQLMNHMGSEVYTWDPTVSNRLQAYARRVASPSQASALAVDALRSCMQTPCRAMGWRASPSGGDEYEVLLQKGSIGLCMNMSVGQNAVCVTGFRRPEANVIGPAEASRLIRVGDDLVAVDGFQVRNQEDFQRVVSRLKSLRPVLLRFRRPNAVGLDEALNSDEARDYRHGHGTSVAGLDNPRVTTAGMWNTGVRYLSLGKWAAELHVDGGGIRRLGIFSSEREAAVAYNRFLMQTYGNAAIRFMNRAGMPSQTPPARRTQRANFSNEQKEQLRAQIMVFKFTSTGGMIPNDLLARALKNQARANLQPGVSDVQKAKRKKFSAEAPPLKPVKRKGKRGKKRKNSDDDDGDNSSDEDFAPGMPNTQAQPTRRSGRNVGKQRKSYVEDPPASDLDLSDEEKKVEKKPEKKEGPQVDKILGVRYRKELGQDDDEAVMEFLIKWKEVSYLHVTWLPVHELERFGHHTVMRLRRYMQKQSREVEVAKRHIIEGSGPEDVTTFVNEAYCEVDRILAMKEVEEPAVVNPYNNHGAGPGLQPVLKRGNKYLVKWRDLSYMESTWEWADELTDDRKIAAYHRNNHPPILEGAPPSTFQDVRPDPTSWAKYQESPTYYNQNELRSYQLEGLNWLVFCWYNRRNCILADEMGLGKTVQATALMEHLRTREHIRGPFLVVAPLVTLGNWKREIETWTTMNCVVYHDSEGGADARAFIRQHEFEYAHEGYRRRNIFKFNVLITSYQTLVADQEFLDCIHWRYVVIDEAHKLKNREAKLLQSLRQFSWDACLLMTGTPLQNGVYELWCLLNFIEPDKFPNQQQFYDEYGDLTSAEQVAQLHEQLRPYMLRRVKEDVEKSIPPKEETIVDVELTTMQKKYYRAIFERNRSFLSMGSAGTMASLVNVEMELRKCCNHPFLIRGVEEKECAGLSDVQRSVSLIQASGKTVLLDKILAKFKAEGKKVLIFSQFKIMLDLIEDLCQLRRYDVERMDGSIRGNARQAAIDRFNNPSSSTFAFLLSTRAGGVGINLVSASVVILFDSDWNPQNDLQAVARCHRIGQTQSVNIYRLVTKKTYEAQMFDIASKKLGMHQAVFETGGVRNEFDGEDGGGDMLSLMSLDRDKVEMMIRYGAYAIMGEEDEHDPENKAINELDIDHLLSSSRTIRYDPTGGTTVEDNREAGDVPAHPSNALSFSKASFTAESSDTTIDFNDEQFWEKVLGPKPVQQLMTQVQEGTLATASTEDVKKFLTALRDLARELVRERQRGGTLADAEQVMNILVDLKVTGPKLEAVNVRQVASEWIEVIERPKRRRNQDAESELMYLEFLDGKIEHKPKSKRRVKAKEGQNEKRKKRTNKKNSGLRVKLHQDDDEWTVEDVRSHLVRVQKQLESKSESEWEHGSEDESEDDEEEGRMPSRRETPTYPRRGTDPQVDSEMWCRVCFSDQGFVNDPIVQCEKCEVAVHQYCYGIEHVPDDDEPWYCDYCAVASAPEPTERSCLLCPLKRKSAAFKKTAEGDWVHVVCALWAPGVQFQDVERMDRVQHVPQAVEALQGTTCNVCGQENGCIECSRGPCTVLFHPLCGRESRGEYDMFMNDNGQLRAYCPRHRPRARRVF